MPAAPSSARHPWAGLYVLAIAVFAVITTEVVPIGLLPHIVDTFVIDEARAGWLVTIYAGLVAVSAVPLTRLTGSLPRKPVLLSTMAVFTLSNTLAAFAPTFAWLVVARALGGLAHALFFAIAIGYSARIAPAGQTGRAMALVATGTSVGLILGVPAGTALADVAGWRVTFGLLGLVVALGLIAAIFLLPAVDHDKVSARSIVPGGGRLLTVAGLAGLAFLGHYALYTYVSPLLLAAGLDPRFLGLMLVILGVAGLLAIRVAARGLDKNPGGWLIGVPTAIALGLAGTSLVFPALWPTLILTTVWVATFGPVNSTYQSVLVKIGRANPEMAGAWINVTCNVGIGAGSAAGGLLLTQAGYPAAGFFGCAVLLATVAITVATRRWLFAAPSLTS